MTAVLAAIKTSLDNLAATLTAQVNLALKKAFTEAVLRVYFWGLFAVAAGFIFTLFLPELALRKTHAPVGAGEGVPGSAPGTPAPGAPAAGHAGARAAPVVSKE